MAEKEKCLGTYEESEICDTPRPPPFCPGKEVRAKFKGGFKYEDVMPLTNVDGVLQPWAPGDGCIMFFALGCFDLRDIEEDCPRYAYKGGCGPAAGLPWASLPAVMAEDADPAVIAQAIEDVCYQTNLEKCCTTFEEVDCCYDHALKVCADVIEEEPKEGGEG